MIYESKSLEDTKQIAKNFLNSLESKNEATVVVFYGDLGAGKTTFIQSLAKEMGIEDSITSPTFVIQKSYKTSPTDEFRKEKYFDTLVHIDAYRLESGEELMKLRFRETLSLPNTLVCIEWPSNVESALSANVIKVECRFVDENTREYGY